MDGFPNALEQIQHPAPGGPPVKLGHSATAMQEIGHINEVLRPACQEFEEPPGERGDSSIRVEPNLSALARLDSPASWGDCGALCGFSTIRSVPGPGTIPCLSEQAAEGRKLQGPVQTLPWAHRGILIRPQRTIIPGRNRRPPTGRQYPQNRLYWTRLHLCRTSLSFPSPRSRREGRATRVSFMRTGRCLAGYPSPLPPLAVKEN